VNVFCDRHCSHGSRDARPCLSYNIYTPSGRLVRGIGTGREDRRTAGMEPGKNKLICTGERVIEDAYKASASSYLIYLFHIATYNFCLPFVRNKRVLDFGCGSGYGTHLTAKHCDSIVGVDISDDATAFAKQTYQADNLEYRKIENIETTPLPFDDATFDTVISFQVMEHIEQVEKYIDEIRRVLRDDGVVVIATPDRSTRLFPGQRPWNEYHVTEYGPGEFHAQLAGKFSGIELYGMSARDDVIGIELKRTRMTRLITYVFTFPGAPEWYRRTMLRMLKNLSRLFGSVYSKKPAEQSADVDYGFTPDDIAIEKDIRPSVNILCVARKSPGPPA